MMHVDVLSRNPVGVVEIYQVDLTETDWIIAAQLQDEQIGRMKNILAEGVRNSETKQYFETY